MDDALRELILYACPEGELAMQLGAYFQNAREDCGSNSAHRYPPHITLTGFYHDTPASIPIYVNALRKALSLGQKRVRCEVRIERMMFDQNFHGLAIESPWLKHLTASFAALATSKTRADAIRLKDWLHLSLAYDFQPAHATHLKHLANALVDISAPVNWEVRLYERHGGDQWRIHAGWPVNRA
jgi:ubiquitin-associated SH3 domain-containing protein